jgi:tRNA dimethylallyltransferase
MSAPAWIALAGPTASGKTGLALAWAQHLPIEIISVDSALVYRGMDIGTAKPTRAEREQVPHHLIDIRDPSASYSAAAFVQDATQLVREIRERGRWPVLVGGTMLYFKALLEGLDDMPASTPELRLAIETEALSTGWPALHAQLAQVDPSTAARLAPHDSQRISRALEVYRSSGRALSSYQQRQHRQAVGQEDLLIAGQPGVFIALEPNNRAWLHHRIAQRFETMMAEGFLDEVRTLRNRPDLHPDLPAMRCVGYRQAWTWLDQLSHGHAATTDINELVAQGVAATRQLAKRQLTWLRSMPYRQSWACDEEGFAGQAVTRLQQLLAHR